MLTFKEGAVVAGNKYTNAIMAACQKAYGDLDVVVTAGRDGKHSPKSYHYVDRALDIRFWNVKDKPAMAAKIRSLLPAYFDVVVESDHFHIEADATKEQ
ncbi:MAG: hypothetical protein CV089_02220 [Nitrospira sp. WS110]|nr:hypothetical protein [Nitrospira sp. WS110]